MGSALIKCAGEFSISKSTLSSPFIPLSNIKAYYKLDDNGSGDVSLVDSTGGGRTLVNAYDVTLGSGKINGCASFDGTQILSNNDMSLGSGNFAISLWVKPNGDNYSYPAFLGTRQGYENNSNAFGFGYAFEQATPDGIYWFSDSQGDYAPFVIINPNVPPDNTWSHIVASRTDGILTVYYNGGNPVSGADSRNYSVPSFGIGGSLYVEQGQNTTGLLDEIGIWSKGLTAYEVGLLYNSGNGLAYPFA